MCFSQGQSLAIAAFGFLMSWFCHRYLKNKKMAIGVFFFFTMELLQFFQYFWVNQCDHFMNQALTLLGFIHICMQPYFTHLLSVAYCNCPTQREQGRIVRKLCIVGGICLFGSWMFSGYQTSPPSLQCLPTDWVRALEKDGLCTYQGTVHLAWSIPMMDPTYITPSTFLHCFLMFAPFLIGDWVDVCTGLFLLITGPLLSMYITSSVYEQASIWCFHSIGQLFLIVAWQAYKTYSHTLERKDKHHL